jgi:hypothetical protein
LPATAHFIDSLPGDISRILIALDHMPCYEAETVQLLREVEAHALQGDIEWLQQHGKVYQALETGGA